MKCRGGHTYCTDCATRGSQVALGQGATVILCLGQCDQELQEKELARALPPDLMARILAKRQKDELERALKGQGLIQCHKCDFSAIVEDAMMKVLVCQTPSCLAETCVSCGKPGHLPLDCDASRDKKEKARKEVEEQLTKAMVRKCHKCNKEFIRDTGCNVMTCPCGAMQCYICHKPLYRHVPCACKGADMTDDQIHARDVAQAAAAAKLKLAKEGVQLDVDPLSLGLPLGQSRQQLRKELYLKWTALSTEAGNIGDEERKRKVLKKLDGVLKLIEAETVVTSEQMIRHHLDFNIPNIIQGIVLFLPYLHY